MREGDSQAKSSQCTGALPSAEKPDPPLSAPVGTEAAQRFALEQASRIETELRASEERFRVAQELSPDGFTILRPVRDAHGEIVDFIWVYENATIARLNGTDPKLVVGRRLSEFFPQHASSPFHEVYRQVTETGQPGMLEARYEGDSVPRPTWFRVAVVPMGQEIAVLAQDITERKQAEEALQRSEARLREQRRRMPIGCIVFDQDNCFSEVNPAAERILGFSEDELQGKHVSTIVPEAARPHLDNLLRRLAEGDMTAHSLNENLTKDGRTILCEWTNTPLNDERGKFAGFLSMAQEVTERERAKEELARLSRVMSEGQKIAHVGSFEYVASTQTTLWSEEEYRIYGLDPSGPSPAYEVMLARHIHPEDATLLHETFSKALRNGAMYELEHRIVRPDGSVRWVHDRAHPRFDANGRLVRYVGSTLDITDRKRTEDRLRRFYETDLYGVLYWKLDGGVVDVNDQFLKMTGYTREEVQGGLLNWSKITPPEFQKQDESGRRQIQETGVHLPFEKQFIRKDGTRVWVIISAAAFEDDRTQGVSLLLDITQRKQTEEALRERERQLRLALEASQLGIYDWDVASNRINWSRWHEQLWGYDEGEFDGTFGAFTRRVHPEDLPGLEAEVARSLAAREDYRREFRVVWPDGSVHWIAGFGQYEYDNRGQAVRMRGVVMDVTERKKGEAALVEHAQLLDLAQILVLDPQDRIVMWNTGAENFYGFSREEALGRLSHELLQTQFPVPPGEIKDALLSRGRWEGELVQVRRDGQPVTVSSLWILHRDKEGAGYRILEVNNDITALKQVEEALRRRNEELTRFTYTISHDLKSPLVTIQTFLGYLEKDLPAGDPSRVQADLNYIRQAAQKMSRLLDELLELSRVGHKLNPPEDVGLQTLVREAMDLVAGRIAERGIHVQITEEPLVLRGDRQRLLEVFQNLLDNAAKFMGDQPNPWVEVGIERTEKETILFVRDNGLGIDPRYQTKLFGLFEKLHPGTPGTGIGLALVKRIVEAHGGRVWAASDGPGCGTVFRFTLASLRPSR
jgi:PAS domain S-box-containing protein